MPIVPKEEALRKFKEFYFKKFTAPTNSKPGTVDLSGVLEHPVFKSIFSSSFVAIIDHSNLSYRYLSSSVKDFTGFDLSEFMSNGPGYVISRSEDAELLVPVFETISKVMETIPKEDRLHFHLFYNYRFEKKDGHIISLYQQTIPLELNENGYPYLMLCLISDVSEFKKDKSISYRATLSLPNQPIKTLLKGTIGQTQDILSDREKEIIQQMAEGHDASKIAEKLFISEGTVRKHRQNILEKTGANNSVHLVRMAIANGWI